MSILLENFWIFHLIFFIFGVKVYKSACQPFHILFLNYPWCQRKYVTLEQLNRTCEISFPSLSFLPSFLPVPSVLFTSLLLFLLISSFSLFPFLHSFLIIDSPSAHPPSPFSISKSWSWQLYLYSLPPHTHTHTMTHSHIHTHTEHIFKVTHHIETEVFCTQTPTDPIPGAGAGGCTWMHADSAPKWVHKRVKLKQLY